MRFFANALNDKNKLGMTGGGAEVEECGVGYVFRLEFEKSKRIPNVTVSAGLQRFESGVFQSVFEWMRSDQTPQGSLVP